MATTISQFFAELATDAQKFAEFQKDPQSVLQSSGLSPDDQELLKSNDAARLNETLRSRGGPAELVQVASLSDTDTPITWVTGDKSNAPITWVADGKPTAPITWVVGGDSEPGSMA